MYKTDLPSRRLVFFSSCCSFSDRVASSPIKHFKTTYNRADDKKEREPLLIIRYARGYLYNESSHICM